MSKHVLDLKDVHLSARFLLDTVGEIQDAPQLKVLLFAIWLAQQSGDEANPLTLQDFYSYPEFINQLGDYPEQIQEGIISAIDANLKTGTFIGNTLEEIQKGKTFYLNTVRGLQASQLQNQNAPSRSVNLVHTDVFNLYEENIGPLTPLIADALKDAEKEYPREWLEEAIRIAVVNNVRKWRYIQAILTNWKEEGRNGRDQRHAEEDYKQYTKGKYGKFIKN
ncbi:MAG TPA: DnaD domain protein [Anaerolineaceae bacterium]|jgi:DNA replication protein|nr:DnaD domain protein [Anaerolineaceae bacterium]